VSTCQQRTLDWLGASDVSWRAAVTLTGAVLQGEANGRTWVHTWNAPGDTTKGHVEYVGFGRLRNVVVAVGMSSPGEDPGATPRPAVPMLKAALTRARNVPGT